MSLCHKLFRQWTARIKFWDANVVITWMLSNPNNRYQNYTCTARECPCLSVHNVLRGKSFSICKALYQSLVHGRLSQKNVKIVHMLSTWNRCTLSKPVIKGTSFHKFEFRNVQIDIFYYLRSSLKIYFFTYKRKNWYYHH